MVLDNPSCPVTSVAGEEAGNYEEEEVGGLFRVSRPHDNKKDWTDAKDCSRFSPDSSHNWDLEEVEQSVNPNTYILLVFKKLY